MNEKNVFIVCLICFVLFTLSSCCTRVGIRDNGSRAYQVREHIGELEDKQTESAVTSERLNGALEGTREQSEELNREIAEGRKYSERLTQSITDGAGYLEEFADILQQIRARGGRNNSKKASPN
ncbi:hypothetical protein [Treponema sp. OMZ 857]|uniref:hypothetical protein n=1 Tax=Treponema sp. OMZ 857 TaxID=1643513 RepID=UPI0020A5D9BF|nr:hypothetical protein [Treponema sp. OMZ 857]UTC44852.1 hypothetical protein E4N66_12595 [Treponema sp. OMZ 857]